MMFNIEIHTGELLISNRLTGVTTSDWYRACWTGTTIKFIASLQPDLQMAY